MKNVYLLLVTYFLSISSYGQSNLIVFSEDGDAFKMTIDGSPAININDSKAIFDGIKGDFVHAKITFVDPELGEFKKGLMIEPNMEITAVLKRNKKGAFVIRPMSSVSIENAPVRTLPPPPLASEESIEAKEEIIITNEGSGTTTITSTETTSSTMNVGVNDPEMGVNMNININLKDMGASISSKISEITTTSSSTTTTTTSSSVVDTYEEEMVEEVEVVCAAMSPTDFASAKKSISSKSFAEDKITLAKQVLRSNCVSTDQVVEVMGLFTFEENKLEFAKMAYSKTVDNQNYYKVNDAFTYSSSIDELNEFLEGE